MSRAAATVFVATGDEAFGYVTRDEDVVIRFSAATEGNCLVLSPAVPWLEKAEYLDKLALEVQRCADASRVRAIAADVMAGLS